MADDPKLTDMGILVVDDEESIGRYLQALLKHHGFANVFTVTSAREALAYFGIAEQPPPTTPPPVDLVLQDIVLPDMSGFEVCLKIKNQVHEYLPVILLTGYEIEDNHAHFVESGADDFLMKPFNPAELVSRVKLMLRRRQKLLEAGNSVGDRPQFRRVEALPGVGKRVGGCVIQDTISWSGSSVVYLATDEATKERRVIKILTRHALDHADVVERFVRETQIMEKIVHPNVVRVLGRGTFEECPYYVMEYIDGPNLEKVVSTRGAADHALAITVGEQVALALGHIHDLGVIHRDVKLKNIYSTTDGTVKLGDFGIAVMMGDLRLTQAGHAIGTPVYMAPEQFDGSRLTPAADIYSFGATMYHLLTGMPPFSATSAIEMLREHLMSIPKPMRDRRPELPRQWDDLIGQCLAKRPEERPQSMDVVHQAIVALRQLPF